MVAIIFFSGHWVGYITVYSLFFHLFLLSLPPTSHRHPSEQVISNSHLSTANNNQSRNSKINKVQIEENSGKSIWRHGATVGQVQSCFGRHSQKLVYIWILSASQQNWKWICSVGLVCRTAVGGGSSRVTELWENSTQTWRQIPGITKLNIR